MDRGDSFDADRRRRTTEGLENKFRTPSPEEEPQGRYIGMNMLRTPRGRIEGRYEINTRGRRNSPSPPRDLTAYFLGEARAYSPGPGPEGPVGAARPEAFWSEPGGWRGPQPAPAQPETRQPVTRQTETRQPAPRQPVPYRPEPYRDETPDPDYGEARGYASIKPVPQQAQYSLTRFDELPPLRAPVMARPFIPAFSEPPSCAPVTSTPQVASVNDRPRVLDYQNLTAQDKEDIEMGLELVRRRNYDREHSEVPGLASVPAGPAGDRLAGDRLAGDRPAGASPAGASSSVIVPNTSTSVEEIPKKSMRPADKFTDRLEPYDGVSEPYESFVSRFEKCSKHYKWDGEDRLYFLGQALAKGVNNVPWDSGEVTNVEQLLKLLAGRYGTASQTAKFRSELRMRRRQKGETLHALYYDIQRLASLAWPGKEGSSTTEENAVEAFADALDDDRVRTEILIRGVKTLLDALNLAVQMEVIAKRPRM